MRTHPCKALQLHAVTRLPYACPMILSFCAILATLYSVVVDSIMAQARVGCACSGANAPCRAYCGFALGMHACMCAMIDNHDQPGADICVKLQTPLAMKAWSTYMLCETCCEPSVDEYETSCALSCSNVGSAALMTAANARLRTCPCTCFVWSPPCYICCQPHCWPHTSTKSTNNACVGAFQLHHQEAPDSQLSHTAAIT
jgi:hypothetical protein